jgi:hypothetical protein
VHRVVLLAIESNRNAWEKDVDVLFQAVWAQAERARKKAGKSLPRTFSARNLHFVSDRCRFGM